MTPDSLAATEAIKASRQGSTTSLWSPRHGRHHHFRSDLAAAHGPMLVIHDDPQEVAMQDIIIRIETDDFEAWKTQHYLHAHNRSSYSITDGPAYRDMDNPNAALFHIKTDDMDRAMEWFKSDTFKEASRLAKVTGRTFYLAKPQT